MATPLAITGAVAIGAEATYGTEASTFVFQHGSKATLRLMKTLVTPSRTQRTAYTEKEYGTSYVEGEIEGDWTFTGTTILDILKAIGVNTTGTVVITGAAPTTPSLSIQVIHGSSLAYKSLGCVMTGLKLMMKPNESMKYSASFIGQAWIKDATPDSVVLPAESQVAFPSTIGALSIGGTAMLFNSAEIEAKIPYTGAERAAYGGALIKQPIRLPGASILGNIELELDDITGGNSIATLDLFIAGTTLGAITFGTTKLQLADCRMLGDSPAWTAGIQNFPCRFESEILTIVTV